MAESIVSEPSPWRTRGRRLLYGVLCGAIVGLVVKDLKLTVLVSYWGPRAPVAVAIMAAFALAFLTRLRWLAAAATVLFAGLWAGVAFGPLSAAVQRHGLREDRLTNADAIFVFASGIQRDGEPTTEAMSRILHGVELLGDGRAPRIIVSEMGPPSPPYAPIVRALLQHFHLSGELLTVGPIRTTHEEGVAVGELCRKNGWKKVIAVTSPVHSRRSAMVLEHEGLTVLASPAVETRYDAQGLHVSDDRLLAFGPSLHEYVGLRWYRLRGFIEGASLDPLPPPPPPPDGGVQDGGAKDGGAKPDAGTVKPPADAGAKPITDAGAKPIADAGTKRIIDAGAKADADARTDAGARTDALLAPRAP